MSPISERVTRKKKIDPLLRTSGWDIQPYSDNISLSSSHAIALGRSFASSGSDVSDEGFDEDAAELNIPIHAFDLIIADECHGDKPHLKTQSGGRRSLTCIRQPSDLRQPRLLIPLDSSKRRCLSTSMKMPSGTDIW